MRLLNLIEQQALGAEAEWSRHVLYEHARLGAVTLNPKRDAFVPPRSTTSQCDIRAAA